MAETKNYLVLNGFTAANPDRADGAPAVVVHNRGDVVALDEAAATVELARNRIAEADEATVQSVRAQVRADHGADYAFQDVA